MPGLTAAAHDAMLDADAAVWPPRTLSLHSTDPGTGTAPAAGELTGGTPAYARRPVTWGQAVARTKTAEPVQFDVPPAGVVAYVGFWTGTTYLGCRENRDDDGNVAVETFTNQGTHTVSGAVETIDN